MQKKLFQTLLLAAMLSPSVLQAAGCTAPDEKICDCLNNGDYWCKSLYLGKPGWCREKKGGHTPNCMHPTEENKTSCCPISSAR